MCGPINIWISITIGLLIIVSTLTKTLGLPYSLSLTQIMSKSSTLYVRYIVIGILFYILIYPYFSNSTSTLFIKEPYDDRVGMNYTNSIDPEKFLATPTVADDVDVDKDNSDNNDENRINNNAIVETTGMNATKPAATTPSSSSPQTGSMQTQNTHRQAVDQNFDVSLTEVKPPPIYYEPGSFMMGGLGFTPTYQQSIYLDKITNYLFYIYFYLNYKSLILQIMLLILFHQLLYNKVIYL